MHQTIFPSYDKLSLKQCLSHGRNLSPPPVTFSGGYQLICHHARHQRGHQILQCLALSALSQLSKPDLCTHSPLSQPSTVTQGQLDPRSSSSTLPQAHQLLRSLIPTFPSSRFLTLCTKPTSLPGRSSFSSLF